MINTENSQDQFYIKFMNLWFYKDQPKNEVTENEKKFAIESIEYFKNSEDNVWSHEKINDMILLFKDYGIVDYEKDIKTIYFEGKLRKFNRLREIYNDEIVQIQMKSLVNVLGKVITQMAEQVKKEDKAKIPEFITPNIANVKINKN